MPLGKRDGERQQELFVVTDRLTRAPGHLLYRRLNELRAEAWFDRFVENKCKPFYSDNGCPAFRPTFISECCSAATSRGSARNGESRGGVPIVGRSASFSVADLPSIHPIIRRLVAAMIGPRHDFFGRTTAIVGNVIEAFASSKSRCLPWKKEQPCTCRHHLKRYRGILWAHPTVGRHR